MARGPADSSRRGGLAPPVHPHAAGRKNTLVWRPARVRASFEWCGVSADQALQRAVWAANQYKEKVSQQQKPAPSRVPVLAPRQPPIASRAVQVPLLELTDS